jgi:hypothetical protein
MKNNMCKYLSDKIKTLIEINYNNMKYIKLINECRKILIEYKNNGGTKKKHTMHYLNYINYMVKKTRKKNMISWQIF